MPPAHHRLRIALEFTAIFLCVPLLAAWYGDIMRRWIIPQILLLAAVFLVVLWRDPSFDRRQLRAIPANWRHSLLRILALFVVGAAGVAFFTWRSGVELFSLVRERPLLWLLVLPLYPLVSALAQEVIFRVFLFHRYRELFPDRRVMVLVSAGVFALAHLQLGNWPSPVLSLLGGVLFASTFASTRSLPMVALEHGLWGDWMFTLGLGTYFYGGHL